MAVFRRGEMSPFYRMNDMREDALIEKLRERVLEGHEPGPRDRLRAIRYNFLNQLRGLPYRAPVR